MISRNLINKNVVFKWIYSIISKPSVCHFRLNYASHFDYILWWSFKANWELDMRAKNGDCEGWMCAIKALTPKIDTEHLMVNALQGFEIVAQAWKIASFKADCEFQCLSHVKPSVCWHLSKWYFQCWNEVVCDLYVVNTFVAASLQGGKAAAKGRVHVTRS